MFLRNFAEARGDGPSRLDQRFGDTCLVSFRAEEREVLRQEHHLGASLSGFSAQRGGSVEVLFDVTLAVHLDDADRALARYHVGVG